MTPRKPAATSSMLVLAGALMCATLLAAGCGITAKVTDYVGDYFQATDTNLRKRMVISPFGTGLPDIKDRAAAIGQTVSTRLSGQGAISLVAFERLAESVKLVDPAVKNPEDRIVAGGRTLGLNAILSGAISDLSVRRHLTGIYGFRDNIPFLTLEVDLKLIDVGTGTVLGETAAHVEEKLTEVEADGINQGQPLPMEKVNKLQAEIIGKIVDWVSDAIASQPWYGYVLEVREDRVLTTAGKDTGLAAGSLLTAYARGEEIVCATGQTVCLPGPPVGKVGIVELLETTAWAKPVTPSGENAKPPVLTPGMILRTK